MNSIYFDLAQVYSLTCKLQLLIGPLQDMPLPTPTIYIDKPLGYKAAQSPLTIHVNVFRRRSFQGQQTDWPTCRS